MSHAEPGVPDDLQFEQAEYAHEPFATATCSVCQEPIAHHYFELAEKVVCDDCRQGMQAVLRGGSKLRRFLRAASFGVVMGALGCAIYYAVLSLTGFHFSVISIAVGYMVGKAVRKGSDNRGGLFYQFLAVFLTYTAIVATFIPMIAPMVFDPAVRQRGVAQRAAAAGKAAGPAAGAAQPAAAPAQGQRLPRPMGPIGRVIFWVLMSVVVLVLAYSLPFFMATSSPLLILIIFFALQQAWWMNRRFTLKFSGPFQVGGLPPEAPEPSYA